jgi:hypothetical protein
MRKLRYLFSTKRSAADRSSVEAVGFLRRSPLFDPVWYRQAYPDLRDARIDLARHYIEHGARERRNPHPHFDTKFYLERYPDVAAANMNPLVHYIKYGAKEGRIAYPPSDAARQVEPQNESEAAAPHIAHGDELFKEDEQGVLPNGFQYAAYAAHNPDVQAQTGNDGRRLFEHWQNFGCKEDRTPFGYFPYRSRSVSPSFWSRRDAITYFGFFDAQSGLGSAARGYRSALLEAGYAVSSVTVANEGGGFKTAPVAGDQDAGATPCRRNKVNIFHLNADMLQKFFGENRHHLLNDSFNIGIWAWELAHFRPDWASAFGALDEIWVPSEFCRAAIATISPIPVITIPHVVPIPGKDDLLRAPIFVRQNTPLSSAASSTSAASSSAKTPRWRSAPSSPRLATAATSCSSSNITAPIIILSK